MASSAPIEWTSSRIKGLLALAGASEEDHVFMEHAMATMAGSEREKWAACLNMLLAQKQGVFVKRAP